MTPLPLPSLRKECRALLPTWVGALVAVVLANQWFVVYGVLAYAIGALMLGAQSMGHEYTHRTVGVLLSHPIDRRRILLVKQGVLAAMLLALAAVASLVLANTETRGWQRSFAVALPVLGGLVLAPWLTMVCRNPLAGVVFSFSIPGVAFTAAELTGYALYRGNVIEGARFAREAWFIGMAIFVPVAAVLHWRRFVHLEVIDGGERTFHLPWLRGAADTRPQHPIWMLAKKELHLQQVTWVIVAIYVVGWAALWVTRATRPVETQTMMLPMTVIYFIALSLLIGSLASAEERQFGTIEWQMLMPMPAWRQWAVKVAVTVGLALLLGIALPALLAAFNAAPDDKRGFMGMLLAAVPTIVLITSMSLYVSSLCSSGVRALAVSFPAMLATIFFAQTVSAGLPRPAPSFTLGIPITAASVIVAAALVALMLWLAFVNHRSADRSYGRVARQLVAIAGVVACAVLLSPL